MKPSATLPLIHALLGGLVLLTGCQPPDAGLAVGTAGKAGNAVRPPVGAGQAPDRPEAPDTPDAPTTPVGPVPQLPVIDENAEANNGVSDLVTTLGGLVKAPAELIGDHGGGIISNNGAGLVGNNGANIIGNNGGSIISNNGSNFISKTKYRVLGYGSAGEGVLANALLYLTNRDEKFYRNSRTQVVFHTRSDASGRYDFAVDKDTGFPLGKDVVVNALVNGNLRLTGYLRPRQDSNTLEIDLATTLATELLRGNAYAEGKGLGDYDRTAFYQAAALTEQAIGTGDIEAVKPVTDHEGNQLLVGTFDLRIDQVDHLRNQYVSAISAVAKGNALLRSLSDTWKAVLGYRPTAVTTVAGNGSYPRVEAYKPDVEGDERNGRPAVAATQVPLGSVNGIAVSDRGDIFIASAADFTNLSVAPSGGHIRWIRPNGMVSSLWLPTYRLLAPAGIAIEKQPSDDIVNNPGTLLVTDPSANVVYRVPIVDAVVLDGASPKWPVEIVAGELVPASPFTTLDTNPHHPLLIDTPTNVPPPTGVSPVTSRWRLKEEGVRRYVTTDALVPNPARYATLNFPTDVKVDELENIYIADTTNHRIRMIVSQKGEDWLVANNKTSFFGYKPPTDSNSDGVPDGWGEFAPGEHMEAGALYTIAGNPTWDTTRTPPVTTGRWFGEFGETASKRAQEAKLDQPLALAWHGGHLYVADFDNNLVRRISRDTGLIAKVAGNPQGSQRIPASGLYDYDYAPGTAGDGGPATSAQLAFPRGLAVDAHGRLYINDNGSGRIRMVDTDGTITTVAGRMRTPGDTAATTDNFTDGDALRWADLYDTRLMAVDPDGNLLFSDARHLRVRKLWRQWE